MKKKAIKAFFFEYADIQLYIGLNQKNYAIKIVNY